MAISARFNDPITNRHLDQSDFFSLLDHQVTDLSKEVFKFLDKQSFLNMCLANKHSYKILTNVHCVIPDDMEDLFSLQANRLILSRNSNALSFDWIILENSYYIRDTGVKLFQCLEPNVNLEAGIPPINIVFRSKNSREHYINLSEKCKRSIFALCNDLRPPEYNCVDFAMESVGLYNENKINSFPGDWEILQVDENYLNSGDIISLCSKNKFQHFAIYMTHGVYLSKFGTNNGLRASTLQDMLIIYEETDAVYKMCLKNIITIQ